MDSLLITPKTKIYDLLEAYPQLEEVLIGRAPEFKRLKNPLLRNTIARVTTLAQAATIGGLRVEALINELRALVGQDNTGMPSGTAEHAGSSGNTGPSENAEVTYTTEPPTWFNPGDIQTTIDVGVLLNQGEQPVHEVLTSLKKLEADQLLEIEAPFIPAPLIDKAVSLGYDHWLKQEADGSCRVYFKQHVANAEEEPNPDDPS